MINIFDIKLTDGRYLQNVDVFDKTIGIMESIKNILNWDWEMEVYSAYDEECENLITEVESKDIEYICKAYEYKG